MGEAPVVTDVTCLPAVEGQGDGSDVICVNIEV